MLRFGVEEWRRRAGLVVGWCRGMVLVAFAPLSSILNYFNFENKEALDFRNYRTYDTSVSIEEALNLLDFGERQSHVICTNV
jgi:hypothetical protein